MIQSRKDLEALDEAELRENILIPLFRAMGYRDVTHYHGGEQELGKDIVMWKPEGILGRVTFAVAAKATRVSGKASGRSAAGELSTQVRQCLNEAFLDPRTSEERFADFCIVVSSHDIKKHAQRALLATLDHEDRRKVRFIEGSQLWELVVEHFPDIPAVGHLAKAQEAFETASEHHRITARLADGVTILSTEPKHPDAYTKEPLVFKMKFAPPRTAKGREFRAALKRHFRTGAPVIVPGAFIQDFEPPEFLRVLMAKPPASLVLGPRQLPTPLMASIVVIPENADDAVRIERIEFRATQVGTDEITLENSHQRFPLHFSLRIEVRKKILNLRYTFKASGLFAKQALEGVRLQKALADGGRLLLEHSDSGQRFGSAVLPAATLKPPAPELLELLREVAFIEKQTGVGIVIPERNFSAKEFADIVGLANRIRSGVVEGSITHVDVEFHRAGAQRIVDNPDALRIGAMIFKQEQYCIIFGSEIPLGTVITTVTGLVPDTTSLAKLKAELQDPTRQAFPARLVPASAATASATVKYLQWLPPHEAEGIASQLDSGD